MCTKQHSGHDLPGSVTPFEVERVSGPPTSSYLVYLQELKECTGWRTEGPWETEEVASTLYQGQEEMGTPPQSGIGAFRTECSWLVLVPEAKDSFPDSVLVCPIEYEGSHSVTGAGPLSLQSTLSGGAFH